MTDHELPLADYVAALREQIRAAKADADEDLPIIMGPVTVEFTLLTRREGEGRAGIKFWVVDAGVTGKRVGESTQKVTIELHPMEPGGTQRARISDVDDDTAGDDGGGRIADTDEVDPTLEDFFSDPDDY